METDAIIARLQASQIELHGRGVEHAALFGSRARGDSRPDSDIDIMIEMRTNVRIGLFAYVELVHAIQDMFPVRLDVSNKAAQKSHVRPSADRDAIYAF